MSGRERVDRNNKDPTICINNVCCAGVSGRGIGSLKSVGDIGTEGFVEVPTEI